MSIKKIRQKAAESYKSIGLPSVKDESWRFTDLSRLSQNDFNHLWKNSELNFNPISEFIIVIENGKISLPKSNIDKLPKGIKILSILDNDLAPIDTLTNKQSGLVLLNTINFSGGVYIHVDKDIQFDPIIHIVYLSDSLNSGNHIRNLIIAEKGSRVTILEEYIGANECLYLTNAVTEIHVHDMAKVDHYKFQSEGNQSFHFQTIESQIGKNAYFNNHVITTGSILGRNDIRGKMLGQNSEAICNGVYLLNNNQLFDTHLFMDHAVPACNSHELYKGILTDKARGVFCGRILVEKDAQQTDAIQSNANLLLSRSAKVNTMPQLEIYADDVKCTHGATIGELDNEALFYLQTRGIDLAEAYSLLTFAFANEVLDEVQSKIIKNKAELIIKDWLSRVSK